MSTSEHARAWALQEARRHLGRVYVWGAADCSQFVEEVLADTAKRGWADLYDGKRRTSQNLDDHFNMRGLGQLRTVPELRPGALVFYRNNAPGARIHHVAMHVCTFPSGVPICIEAGGAGSAATTFEKALRYSGSVRYSDSDYHGAGVEWWARDPFAALT